jgi:hypothetical protein
MKFNGILFTALLAMPSLSTQAVSGAVCTTKNEAYCALEGKPSAQTVYQEQRTIYSSGGIMPLMHSDESGKATQPSPTNPIVKKKPTSRLALQRADSLEPPNLEEVYSALDPQGRRDLKKCFALMTDTQIRSHLPTFDRNTISIKVEKKVGRWFRDKATKATQNLCQSYFKTIFS